MAPNGHHIYLFVDAQGLLPDPTHVGCWPAAPGKTAQGRPTVNTPSATANIFSRFNLGEEEEEDYTLDNGLLLRPNKQQTASLAAANHHRRRNVIKLHNPSLVRRQLTVNPVESPGSMSYTVICKGRPEPQQDIIISFRKPGAMLDEEMVDLAKEIHGDLVPESTCHGYVEGSNPPLSIYSMSYLRGSSCIEVLAFQVEMDPDQ